MSLTRPLTRPLTRKISRAEITQGYGGSFSPLLLNPYLLFDARESMVGTLENPTLDLNPALPETLDVITAIRSGTATYTDANGNIATAAADTVRVDYTQGEELTPTKFQNIGYTDFSQGWTAGGANLVISDGDGLSGNISKTLTLNDTLNQSYYYAPTTVENQVYTGGFWIRRLSGTGSVYLYHLFSATGTQTDITNEITSEWSFISKEFLGRSGGGGILFGLRLYAQGNSVEIAMPQVEEGTTASDFVANTTGSPKFITGATYGPRVPMILVEPSATNLVEYSEDFSAFTATNTTITVNDTESPDGNITASKITASSGTVRKSINRFAATTNATEYTVSFYAKAGSHQFVQTYIANNGSIYANFDLVSGQTQAFGGTTSKMTLAANGFYRCEFTYTGASDLVAAYIIFADSLTHARAGDSSADGYYYIWGAQVEAGSVATSYIPTSGSTVTRAADDLVISGSDFSDFFNGSEGTFYIEAVDRQATGSSHAYLAGQSTSQFFIYKNAGSTQIYNLDGTNILDLGQVVSNQLFRAAVTYKTGVSPAPSVISLSFNGTSEVDQPYSESFAATNILKIGSGYAKVFSGHFRRILFWPYHSDRL